MGLAGLAERAWSRSLGRLFDLRIVFECRLPTETAKPPLASEVDCEEIRISEQPEAARQAASLQRVSLEERRDLQLFVARDSAGRIVACTWNEKPEGDQARHRGIAVEREWRGRGISSELLLFQAKALARRGARVVLYRTSLGNRASRRMLHKAGAELDSIRLLTIVAGRCVSMRDLSDRWGSWMRRQWERERDAVLAQGRSVRVPAEARSRRIS